MKKNWRFVLSEDGIIPPKLMKWYLSNILRKIEELDKGFNELKGMIYGTQEENKNKSDESV